MEQSVEQVRAHGKRLTRSAVSVDSQITQGRGSGSGAGGGGGAGLTGACRPSRSVSKTPRNLPLSLSTIFPSPPAGVLRSMFRAEHPYERGGSTSRTVSHGGQSQSGAQFSQLPLSRVEGSVCVAVSVVRASLAV